jgi:hypothetical protein
LASSSSKSLEEALRKGTIITITQWVQRRLSEKIEVFQPSVYEIMMTELQCSEPGYVPIEMLVVVMSVGTSDSAPVVPTEQLSFQAEAGSTHLECVAVKDTNEFVASK